MAFAGSERELAARMDVSTSGLLSAVKDKKVINEKQYHLVEVSE